MFENHNSTLKFTLKYVFILIKKNITQGVKFKIVGYISLRRSHRNKKRVLRTKINFRRSAWSNYGRWLRTRALSFPVTINQQSLVCLTRPRQTLIQYSWCAGRMSIITNSNRICQGCQFLKFPFNTLNALWELFSCSCAPEIEVASCW